MTQNGWIKLSRKMLSWRWYRDLNTKAVFIHLLLTANIEDGQYRTVTVHRGELVTTAGQLSEQLGISVRSIRSAIAHLKATGEVSIKQHSKFVVISIKNYNEYQGTRQANVQATVEAERESSVRQVSSLHYIKNSRKEEGENAAVAAAPESLPRRQEWQTFNINDMEDDDDDY